MNSSLNNQWTNLQAQYSVNAISVADSYSDSDATSRCCKDGKNDRVVKVRTNCKFMIISIRCVLISSNIILYYTILYRTQHTVYGIVQQLITTTTTTTKQYQVYTYTFNGLSLVRLNCLVSLLGVSSCFMISNDWLSFSSSRTAMLVRLFSSSSSSSFTISSNDAMSSEFCSPRPIKFSFEAPFSTLTSSNDSLSFCELKIRTLFESTSGSFALRLLLLLFELQPQLPPA